MAGHDPVDVTTARRNWADITGRVAYAGERIRLSKNAKPVAALVPIADVELLELIEDILDIAAAEAALADYERDGAEGWITLDQLRAELGDD